MADTQIAAKLVLCVHCEQPIERYKYEENVWVHIEGMSMWCDVPRTKAAPPVAMSTPTADNSSSRLRGTIAHATQSVDTWPEGKLRDAEATFYSRSSRNPVAEVPSGDTVRLSIETQIQLLINEVAPPPLVVSGTAIRQLQPLLVELIARRKQDALAHSIAYDSCCSIIESNCVAQRDNVDASWDPIWFDTGSADEESADSVNDSVTYLQGRGLLDRHPEHSDWVQLRDESEANGHE